MHTGGQIVRIVASGYPRIPGKSILEKRRYVEENCDHIRQMLMLEPRGSEAVCGLLITEADLPNADIAVLFMHGEGAEYYPPKTKNSEKQFSVADQYT